MIPMAEEKSKTELLREKLMNDPKTIKKLDAEENYQEA